MHMSCQRKNFLSKQTPQSSTSEWSTRADALNVSLVATRGTGVRLGHTHRGDNDHLRVLLCLNPSRPAQDRTLGRIVSGGVRFHSTRTSAWGRTRPLI